MTEKTKEELLKPLPTTYEYDGHGGSDAFVSKDHVVEAMQAYADQEKRKEAIAFAEWIVDNDWYQNQANEWIKRGDLAEYIATSELHERYLQSLTQHT